ncbi:MAG: hypothetical protein JKY60_00780 [Kordiimonadaceae bacterium]|nr:hypothetical protein [Kordiimonadaceae bacterium]
MDDGKLKMKTAQGERVFEKSEGGQFKRTDQPLIVAVASGEDSIRMTYDTLAVAYLTVMPASQEGFEIAGSYQNTEKLPMHVEISKSDDGYQMQAAGRTLKLIALEDGLYQSGNGAYVLGFGKTSGGRAQMTLFHDGLGAEQLQRQ